MIDVDADGRELSDQAEGGWKGSGEDHVALLVAVKASRTVGRG